MRTRRLSAISVCVLVAGVSAAGAAGPDARLPEAAKAGNTAAVRTLLQQHVDVNAPEADSTTALHWAVHRDDLELTQLLIRSGANVKAANRFGVTPLTLACTNGNAAIVEALLKAGADPNTALPEGETALMTASRTGTAEVVKLLLARGAAVDAKEGWRGQTALMWAAAEKHPEVVQTLVERGASVAARSKGGLTPLLFAVRAGDLESVRLLLAAGANVNDAAPDGTSALVLSIINARYDVTMFLLDKDANPNAPDPRGSALHALAFMRKPGYPAGPSPVPTAAVDTLTVARALLTRGANPNTRIEWKEINFDRDGGVVKSPPNIAIGRNFQSFIGATPFYLAARGGDVALMRLLASNGADVKAATRQNVTPLMAAAGLGFWDGESPAAVETEALEAVKLAVALGNDVNAVADFGDTPSETDGTVLLKRHPLKLAGSVGDMRWSGCTALHGAALRGANSIVAFLVEKGARVDATNKIGWTPLVVAQGVFVANTVKEHPETATLIRQLMKK